MSFDAGSEEFAPTSPEPSAAGVNRKSNVAPAGRIIPDARDAAPGFLPGVDAGTPSEEGAMTAVARMERSVIGSMDARAGDKHNKNQLRQPRRPD